MKHYSYAFMLAINERLIRKANVTIITIKKAQT